MTPDTVVAVLTVLGYSLYDTVVVFDRIRDNAKGLGASGRITYSEMVNLSMNQTLARSINTSLVAIVPVLSVLVVGSFILGATSLQDFGLALVIGLTSGAYSSIFIASPLLAMMKEREPRYITIRQRLEARGDRGAVLTPAIAAAMAGAAGGGRAPGRAGQPATGRHPARARRRPPGAGRRRQAASAGRRHGRGHRAAWAPATGRSAAPDRPGRPGTGHRPGPGRARARAGRASAADPAGRRSAAPGPGRGTGRAAWPGTV